MNLEKQKRFEAAMEIIKNSEFAQKPGLIEKLEKEAKWNLTSAVRSAEIIVEKCS